MTPEQFKEWLCREMPAGTIIGDPAWWAPRIYEKAKAPPEATGIPMRDLCYLYWSAYHAGHHDTVESRYTDVYSVDRFDYHGDAVNECLASGDMPAFHGRPSEPAEATDPFFRLRNERLTWGIGCHCDCSFCLELDAAILALVKPQPAEATGIYDSAWVIEGMWRSTACPEYWVGSSAWSSDPYKALRFASKQSAQQAADMMLVGINHRVACHEFAGNSHHE